MRHDYYGMDGQAITQEEAFAIWEGDFEQTRRVAHSTVGKARVSTVLLVFDHGYGDERPQIFETMVFDGPEGWENFQWRYATREEAEQGHALVVERLSKGAEPPWEDE